MHADLPTAHRALHRDAAKLLAIVERDPERSVPTMGTLAELWAARDQLADDLTASAPPDPSDTLAEVTDATAEIEIKLAQASMVRGVAEERVQAASRWLGSAGAERARRDLAIASAHEARLHDEHQQIRLQHAACLEAQQTFIAWADEHADDVRQLTDLDKTIHWRARLAGRAAEIDRPEHVVSRIGAPPTVLSAREQWRDAAAAIESYFARWHRLPDPTPADDLSRDEQIHLDAVSETFCGVASPPEASDVAELA